MKRVTHCTTPLEHAGYGIRWAAAAFPAPRITAPDGTVFVGGTEASVIAAALTHMGLATGYDGDLLTATVAVRGDDGVMVDRRFIGVATMAEVDDWGSTERVRVLRESGGTYRWDTSLPPSHSGIGHYLRWFGLTGRWADEAAAQREAGKGDPMAPVFRTRRSRTGLVTHTRCGQAIGTVGRAGRMWRWSDMIGDYGQVARTMREGTDALLRLHLPECPHSSGCRTR